MQRSISDPHDIEQVEIRMAIFEGFGRIDARCPKLIYYFSTTNVRKI